MTTHPRRRRLAGASRSVTAPVCIGLMIALAACGSGDSDTSADPAPDSAAAPAAESSDPNAPAPDAALPGEGLTIGFVAVTNCANPTICAVLEAVKAEAEAAGAETIVLEWGGASGTNPVDAMISNIDQLIAEDVDALGVWAVDQNAASAPISRAAAAGIPVFTFDNTDVANTDIVSSVVAGRELQAKQAAEYLCEARPDGGTVLYGDYGLPIPSLQFLKEKFEENIAECSGGNLEVVVYQNATDDVAGARLTAEPALLSNPDTVAIAGYNDPTSVGGSQAAESLGVRDDLVIAGYNLAPDGVDALTQGRLDVSWDFQPVVLGQIITKQMIAYVTGEDTDPPPVTVVWPKCYDVESIAEAPGNEALLESIRAGEDTSLLDPDLISTGEDNLVPGDDLPGCPEQS